MQMRLIQINENKEHPAAPLQTGPRVFHGRPCHASSDVAEEEQIKCVDAWFIVHLRVWFSLHFFSSQDPETNYFWKLLHNHVPVVVQSSFSESKSFFRFHMQVVLPGQSLELSVDVTLLPRRMTTFGHLNHFFLIFTQPSSLWSFASGKHTTVPICRQTHSSQSDKWLQTNSQCIQATACSPAAWQSRTRLTAILVVLESEGQVDPQSPKLELA